MKASLTFIMAVILVLSCKKQIKSGAINDSYISSVKNTLRDSLSNTDFKSLDFSSCVRTFPDSSIGFLRIPFKGIKLSDQFVLLKTRSVGKIIGGFIINLKKQREESNYIFNGVVNISSLDRKSIRISTIVNGYITLFHSTANSQRTTVVPGPSIDAEVIESSDAGGSLADWLSLESFFGSQTGGYYSSINGGGTTGGNSDGNSISQSSFNPDGTSSDNYILVDFEPVENLSPIDITKYLKCFSNIPDNGSTCSIEIFTDIPVDSDPNKFFNWTTASPGHTFLQIRKTLGNQTVIQNIGFYPVTGWKTLLSNAPVDGKFVDNSEHEYNAGLKMDLTPEQLQNTLIHISYLSRFIKYDIDDYNCTDFALDVFNYSRPSNPLQIPKYDIPGGMTPNGTNTPQGLYNELNSMKNSSLESNNITVPGTKKWAADGKGPCN